VLFFGTLRKDLKKGEIFPHSIHSRCIIQVKMQPDWRECKSISFRFRISIEASSCIGLLRQLRKISASSVLHLLRPFRVSTSTLKSQQRSDQLLPMNPPMRPLLLQSPATDCKVLLYRIIKLPIQIIHHIILLPLEVSLRQLQQCSDTELFIHLPL
jgi:hypothetical protein